jgi:GntR family transcriptional regulator
MKSTFTITTGNKTPIYKQLVNQVVQKVALGDLRPGDPLPSIRALAEELVINPNTIARVYNELSRDGIVASKKGKGYFIVDRRQIFSKEELRRRFEQALENFLGEIAMLGFSNEQIKVILETAKKILPEEGSDA